MRELEPPSDTHVRVRAGSAMLLDLDREARLAEFGVFAARASATRPDARYPLDGVNLFRRVLLRILDSLADKRHVTVEVKHPYKVLIAYSAPSGRMTSYATKNEFLSARLYAVTLLAMPDFEILRCAYERCGRGYQGARRLFIRSRHSIYCCATCGTNAASQRFFAKPENRSARLKRRKAQRAEKINSPKKHKERI